ncbi:trans-aconitate 2-methyltransferase [Nocardiopsis sp. MG754419]|uniref:class I SAM-dependent methyltransferase n=1 Tax=Nocardiopsis sp. MG754419 TaxID=2259865 RepID=UPI001BA5DD3C|nr:class I SAM-dependent methyltransferase [Nocardiopsis sp. MG754419]MBR8741793.1 hypothetical protein [Nocardiopsis sp. MG754419]
MTTEYAFDSDTDLGRGQLDHLSSILDGVSRDFIGTVAARTGQRCLELGAGNGSLARWMTERVGPTGEVHAVDLVTTHLDVPGGRVHRHDINDGLPVEGPFDLIHARLLLVHLEHRREILSALVDALAPGGWLVLGEFAPPPTAPLAARSTADADLYHHVVAATVDGVGRGAGLDYDWAHASEGAMVEEGLVEVDTMEYRHTARGGSATCGLNSNYLRQLTSPLLTHGVTVDEIDRFHRLMLDPELRVAFFPFVCVRGRAPMSA